MKPRIEIGPIRSLQNCAYSGQDQFGHTTLANETVPVQIKRMCDELARVKPDPAKAAREFFGVRAGNLARLKAAGVRIGFGTDSSNYIG